MTRRAQRRTALALVGAYLVLLAASHAVRRPDPPPPELAVANLTPPDGGAGEALVAWRVWRPPAGAGEAIPVLLLHGSPGSSADFLGLGPLLAGERTALAPDLPGFGHSQKRVPDYSIAAHAGYALALLDRLGIDRAHLVGFSMGGGVGILAAGRQPQRVASLTLLSAIGVQELELLGSYGLNHAVHGLQLAALATLHEATPHFGLLDGFPLDVAYARNFYDTDQRPLRPALASLDMPVLVLHGARDPLVPAAAAREHHRLVPHSELVMLDASHFAIFRRPALLAGPLSRFLERVDRGEARRRSDAEPARLAAAGRPFDPSQVPAASGLSLALLCALIALATLASEDATSIATGLLVAQGRIGFVAGSAACAAGILLGDLGIWAAGRFLGRPWLRRAPLKWMISPDSLARSATWFERRGPAVITLSRFLPGTRVATYFVAGLLDTGFWRFLLFFTAAVAVWTPLVVGLSAWLGVRLLPAFELFERWALPAAAGLAVTAWLVLGLARRLATARGRRLLLGAVRRKLEWEFWPWWAIYLPLLPWIAWLGLRHRSLTVFTAANPGIELGGFAGESKAAILDAVPSRWLPPWLRLAAGTPPHERRQAVDRFLARHQLAPPVVLKPDVGERGEGVRVLRSAEALAEAVAGLERDSLLQAYVAGPELGVFWFRHPGSRRGRIFSITEKRLPAVTGDGESMLEQLILADERAMRMAPTHFAHLAGRLTEVPAAGEQVALVEVGTHRLGAVFLDGARFHTPELAAAVGEIALAVPGFYFGRFDLRAPSWEAFSRGEGLRVIELNGVTSEATHIYDPANSYRDALRVLRRQWRLAFEIGAANRARGVRPAPLAVLVRRAVRHLLRPAAPRRRAHTMAPPERTPEGG